VQDIIFKHLASFYRVFLLPPQTTKLGNAFIGFLAAAEIEGKAQPVSTLTFEY